MQPQLGIWKRFIIGLLVLEKSSSAGDVGGGLVPRLMIICGLLAAELAEDWFQGLSKG